MRIGKNLYVVLGDSLKADCTFLTLIPTVELIFCGISLNAINFVWLFWSLEFKFFEVKS